ncbi:GGDEF domain-containing protein [uncultured Shewanella sp.]|uniref:tetratricopeptide repeat-containing diguanylate cyclase n=1 Tax=uncultured Shewanella sp. TaxID=173975 RepID=UPI002621CDD7|nr:GGDEF domain-containing protein [uncultured Shewanella sp.]
MKILKIVFVLGFSFFITPLWSDEILDVQSLLDKTDEVRTSDASEFNRLLEKLSLSKSSFTAEELEHYQYLAAYKMAFNGNFIEAQKIWSDISEFSPFPRMRFRANISLINTYAISKQWNKGLVVLEENLSSLKLIRDSELSQLGVSATALFYNRIGQYELGLKYAEKLNSLFIQGRNFCIAKHQIVEAKFYLKQLNINSVEFSDAIEACRVNNEPIILSSIYTFMANVHLESHNTSKAIDLLESNIKTLEDVNYIPILSHFYALLAKSYFMEGNEVEAKRIGLKTIQVIKKMSNTESEIIAYEILYQIAVNESDFESALSYYIKFAEADKAYFDDLKTKYLAFQLAQHKAVEQKVQIELLNKQNKLLQASQRLAESETENNRLFMALLIMVISLLAIAAIRSNRNQKRLKYLAEHDSLTQIYNRGHFTSAAQDAMQACQINQDDISCILFDLDKFKTINDNYGHACGDWVLKTVASTCKSIGRKNDIFARLGGEEFCIILSRCDANTAMKIAEDYRKAIEAIDSAPSGNTFPITASFGVTDSRLSGYSLEALTGHADNAMYLAKDTGRNQVCSYRDVVAADDSNSVII